MELLSNRGRAMRLAINLFTLLLLVSYIIYVEMEKKYQQNKVFIKDLHDLFHLPPNEFNKEREVYLIGYYFDPPNSPPGLYYREDDARSGNIWYQVKVEYDTRMDNCNNHYVLVSGTLTPNAESGPWPSIKNIRLFANMENEDNPGGLPDHVKLSGGYYCP